MEGGYTAAQFHPDGLILGAGTQDSLVRIWEVRQQKVSILLPAICKGQPSGCLLPSVKSAAIRHFW